MKTMIVRSTRCSNADCSCGCFRITETNKPGRYLVNDEHGNAVIMVKEQIIFLRDLAASKSLVGSQHGVSVARDMDRGSAKEFVISVVGEGKIYGSLEEVIAFTSEANVNDLDILIQSGTAIVH